MIELINNKCQEYMPNIADKSIDMILCDLPYGTTANSWDKIIPSNILWKEYNRIIKDNGIIALFASQPFTTYLINSNLKNFKYCWYWLKNQGTNFFHASRMPIRKIEEVCIFKSNAKSKQRYFPQKTEGHIPTNSAIGCSNGNTYFGTNKRNYDGGATDRFPINLLEFKCVPNYGRLHSSQKPVELLEYLISTYTSEDDVVLDNCMGSGSTGIACMNLKRNFIGIENDEEIFNIAKERISNHEIK